MFFGESYTEGYLGMDENKTISVIVPVYGIDYSLLRCCLDTLEAQDYAKTEFILVDDGSPDECGVICDEYARRDARFRVFHKQNAGVSSARNHGMKHAIGEYFLFVDADDGLYPGFLSSLSERLKTDSSDIVFFNYTQSKMDGKNFTGVDTLDSVQGKLPSTYEIAKSIVKHTDTMLGFPAVMFGSPWGKAFKASFIGETKCKFPLGIKKTQDRIFMVDVLSHNPEISYFPRYGYVYVEQTGSICRRYNPAIFDILNEAEHAFVRVIEKGYSGKRLD